MGAVCGAKPALPVRKSMRESERKMLKALIISLSSGAVIGTLAIPCASADIYAWVDKSGHLTLSDVAPPPGVEIINVVSEPLPRRSVRSRSSDELRESEQQAQVRALSDRVRQLERQVENANYQPPPPVYYGAVPPVPATRGCDYGWADCNAWWGAPIYPFGFGVTVVAPRGFHRFHRFHGARGFAHSRGGFHRH